MKNLLLALIDGNKRDFGDGALVSILAIVLGIAGAATGGYLAYKNAEENGYSVGGQIVVTIAGIITGGFLGALLGAGIGYAIPAILSVLSTPAPFALAGIAENTITLMGGSIALTAVDVLVASLGLGLLFFKGDKPRLGHNQHEKHMWEEAMRRLNIKDKDLRRRLHEKVHKYPYQQKLDGLLKILREILEKMGRSI